MPSTGERTDRAEITSLAGVCLQYLSYLQVVGKCERTLYDYRRTLFDFGAFCKEKLGSDDIRLIHRQLVECYADRVLRWPFAEKGKNEWLNRLKIFFLWASSTGIILSDPASSLRLRWRKEKSVPVYISQKEMLSLLESTPVKTASDLRDRALQELLYSTGIRSGEVARLNHCDINFAEATVKILLGKGSKDRVVPIGKHAVYWIRRYINEVRGVYPGALFTYLRTPRGVSTQVIGKIIRNAAKRTRLKKRITAHIFRHSFAVHLLEGGADIRHISAMLGHEHLVTTQIYTRVLPRQLQRAHLTSHPAERRRSALPPIAPSRIARKKRRSKK